MRILIRIDCTTQPLDVQPSDTIKDVMDKLQLKFNIPVDQQRLFWGTRRLDANSSLAEYRINAEAKITLMRSLGSTAAKDCPRGRSSTVLALRASTVSCSPVSTSPVPGERPSSRGFETVEVHVSGIGGSCLCVLSAEASNSMESIKLLIQERVGIDPSEQKLCCDSELSEVPSDFDMVGRLAKEGRLGLTLVRLSPEHVRLLNDVKAGVRTLASLPREKWEDSGLVLAAVRAGDQSAIKLLAEGYLNFTRELALEAVAVDDGIFEKLPENMQNDVDIVLSAISRNSRVLQHVSTALKGDRDFVIQAVSKNGLLLQQFGPCFRRDRDVVLAAVRSAGGAIRFASDRIKKDREVLLAACANDASILRYLDLDVLQSRF